MPQLYEANVHGKFIGLKIKAIWNEVEEIAIG